MAIDAQYGIQIHEGMHYGQKPLYKFGFNPSIATDEETIWDQGGVYSYLSSASVLKVSSSNNSDTSVVNIEGLDANYNQISETVTLSGQTAVNTSNSFIRVYRGKVTDDEPSGDIYIGTGAVTTGIPANIYAKITAGENQTLMALWSVPAGYTAYVFMSQISSGTSQSNKFLTSRLKVRPFGEVFQTKIVQTLHNQTTETDFGIPIKVEEKSDIEVTAKTSSGTDAVSATFSVIYKKND
jgi:hypothetical protein